jgi:hypothetical protein
MTGNRMADSAVFATSAPDSAPARRWQPDWVLLAVCALSAVPSIYLALTQFVEYDGFWHVFIAQQDNWKNFLFDYKANDHPLLFYLMLKLVMKLGHSVFLYRSVPIACDLASVYVIGRIARKLSVSRFTPVLTAMAFGFSMATIEISVSVRSYMLAIFFVVLSFYYFLDLFPGTPVEDRGRARMAFGSLLLLAVSSHYFTFFYVAACGLVLLGVCLFSWSSFPWKTWLADGLAFVPVAWLMRYYYRTHIRLHTVTDDYLALYSFKGNESKPEFFFRNLQNIFNFVSPWTVEGRGHFLILVGVLALIGMAILLLVRSRAVIPLLMLAVLVGELAWAGFRGKYPFGGLLRQQYILFPFVVLSAGVYFDRLLALIHARWWSATLAVFVAVALLTVSVSRFEKFPKLRGELFTDEMNRFNAAIPEARAVYLDQFNLIAFFAFHHQWKWHFDKRLYMATGVDEYTLTRGRDHMAVLRDRTRWLFDFSDPAFIHDIAEGMRAGGLDSLAVFCIHQVPGTRTPDQQDAFQQKVFQMADAEHLRIRKFVPDALNVYAEFERAPAVSSR